MNYTTAIFLINNKARAITVAYEPEEPPTTPWNGQATKTKTSCGLPNRMLFKTLDPDIKKDDYVVVPTHTRHGMTVCRVVEADVDVDFDSAALVAWIVAKVDRAPYDQTIQQEDVAIAAIRKAETRKKRNDLRDAILTDQLEAIQALPIASA